MHKRSSAKVYIDSSPLPEASNGSPLVQSAPSGPVPPPRTPSPKPATRKRVTLRLSHDISTEQLFSDQLIDAKVPDGEDDDVDDDEEDAKEKERMRRPRRLSRRLSNAQPPLAATAPAKTNAPDPSEHRMYRIESHSHLSSLDAKHLDKQSALEPPVGAKNNRIALAPLPKESVAVGSTVCIKCAANKEMPPLHCAAYSGHTACLTLLLDQDAADPSANETAATRPSHLDKKRRTPLFYACAASRLDCCSLLLTKRLAWRDLPDKQLDTPVHVCCFFGWHECLQTLLTHGADPHGRNAKGFKPSHIAKTRECLELLLSYGDDLQQGDKLDRTPLFVACARDRSVCVEFLCAWNHQTKSWMLEQEDQRGDRPIHAAACNGSDASLEVLLKYGADPLIQNAKGMTPKDLALANNHQRCVELLAKAEEDLAASNAWFAPANAIGTASAEEQRATANAPDDTGGWIECWDNSSGQPFYYNNLSGKCQWEVPDGFQPRLLDFIQQNATQQQKSEDDESGEYVWVKKKRQTVCVVTGKESEWTAVQDPVSKAIYYKNTRTGQSQWEEPDAVQQLQSASAALASQHASKIWDELETSRTALARALAADKQRQLQAQEAALEAYKLEIQRRRDDIHKKEEQARLQQLLPRSSFIRRKKQSMMIKIKGSNASASKSTRHIEDEEDKMERICAREPSLDIFLSTYVRLHGVRDLQLSLEKRFFNCLFHYYVALVDPVKMSGLSKSQFRTVLRDAAIIPSSFASANDKSHATHQVMPSLKLHVVDLIFAQAARVEAMEVSSASHPHGLVTATGSFSSGHAHSQLHRQAVATSTGGESQLGVVGFVAAMKIVRERMVAMAEESTQDNQPLEIDDDEEWFLTTYVLPLTVRLGSKMLTLIRECKELDLEVAASPAIQQFLSQNRLAIQRLHRYYTGQEPSGSNSSSSSQLRMLTFRGLSLLATEFCIAPQLVTLPILHQLYESVNWISGHAHTEIISFEKFQQLLAVIASHTFGRSTSGAAPPTGSSETVVDGRLAPDREATLLATLVAFLRHLEGCPSVHRVVASTAGAMGSDSGAVASTFFVLECSHLGSENSLSQTVLSS